jgi:NDP-sugar pyrophosphorylase family protein
VIQLDGDNRISGYIEKPSMDYQVSMGMYVFEPRVLDYIPYSEYLDFPDLVHKLLEHGEHVEGYPFDGYWRDLGRQEDYQEAQEDFSHMREQILGECQ